MTDCVIPNGYKRTPLGVIPQEWEVRRFKDVGKFLKNNTLSREKMSENNGCVQNIHYGDVLIKYREILNVPKNNIPWIRESKDSTLGDMLRDGDIVISDTAEDYTVGKATELLEINGTSLVAGLHTMPFRPLPNLFSPCFLGYYINSMAYRFQLYPLVQGTKVCAISKKAMSGTFLIIPPLPEQQKIAEIISTWNKAIEKQSRLIEKLEMRKKGLTQQLLTAKRRLPGFSTPWKKVKLGEICNITTGKLDANAMEDNGIYPFFTCAKDVYKINKYAFDTEALLISGNGEYVGYVHYCKGKFNAYQRTYVLDRFRDNIFYLKYTLQYYLPKRILQTKSNSNTPYIVIGTLKYMIILEPSMAEQTAIAEVLKTADHEIELAKQKLELFRQQKHGLMQQLLTGKKRVKL